MDSTQQFEFLHAFDKRVANHLRAHVLIDGIVTAVNDNFTCDITVNDTPYSNVPIKVLIGSQASIYEIPVVGTHCLVKWRDGHRQLPQIDSFDQISDYYIQPINNLFISSKQIQFNDGSNGGLPLSPNVSDRLNKIENAYNDLVTKFNSHIHILALTSGTGTAAITANPENTTLTPTQPSDIENPDITQ